MKKSLEVIKRVRNSRVMGHRVQAFTLPEVLIAGFLLAFLAAASAKLTNSALRGMSRSSTQTQADAVISRRLEKMREASFNLFCLQGCKEEEISQQLIYDLALLKPECGELGAKLKQALTLQNLLNRTTTTATFPPVEITFTPVATGNQVRILIEAPQLQLKTSTVFVPQAQGWCP